MLFGASLTTRHSRSNTNTEGSESGLYAGHCGSDVSASPLSPLGKAAASPTSASWGVGAPTRAKE
eukprot:CAMPEP_0204195530 /NCGR_PEP_ID=MMETSP0361-20130328/63164_1 /ASSEMBLY_ACC=CAM_ASM_000343 /TAXON_ID=268821 /ORGANISM="Scrippsiella Hangoei, Strain SHTV-5" /LENGTH=64 /DNA_ID=CAMNT_0051157115 /DNA_START=162 /DNA_END=353 /DNA_ORIENTATION=+